MRPVWLSGRGSADDGGEADYINEFYRAAHSLACKLCLRFPGLIPASDLRQHGVMGALKLYRSWGGRPPEGLAVTAAWREMFDQLRPEMRRLGVRNQIFRDLEINIEDERLDLRAIDLKLDAARLLALVNARQQSVLSAIYSGRTAREVAGQLGLSEGRISQLRVEAIARIRAAAGILPGETRPGEGARA